MDTSNNNNSNSSNTSKRRDYLNIISGPSRDKLFDACKYAYDKEAKVLVNFTIATDFKTSKNDLDTTFTPVLLSNVRITGLIHEDGSGESFSFHGYCKVDPAIAHMVTTYNSNKIHGYYNAKHRQGWIYFVV